MNKNTHSIKWDLKQGLQLEPLTNDLCYEYSEDKKHLKQLLALVGVNVQRVGYQSHFNDENIQRTVLKVTLMRGSTSVSFKYGMSTNDSEYLELNKVGMLREPSISDMRKKGADIRKHLLYDILACCHSDSFVPDTFEDFCSEFGYNQDSKKDTALFLRCLTQRACIVSIFHQPGDINSLPS